ncbi:DUF4114 domain-containing protein [Oceanicella actignis]|uniref:DUF4114 domain-containing protein n=1 Tax=Oceanicella actignis TaxID=1189325 RepID=UPI0014787FC1
MNVMAREDSPPAQRQAPLVDEYRRLSTTTLRDRDEKAVDDALAPVEGAPDERLETIQLLHPEEPEPAAPRFRPEDGGPATLDAPSTPQPAPAQEPVEAFVQAEPAAAPAAEAADPGASARPRPPRESGPRPDAPDRPDDPPPLDAPAAAEAPRAAASHVPPPDAPSPPTGPDAPSEPVTPETPDEPDDPEPPQDPEPPEQVVAPLPDLAAAPALDDLPPLPDFAFAPLSFAFEAPAPADPGEPASVVAPPAYARISLAAPGGGVEAPADAPAWTAPAPLDIPAAITGDFPGAARLSADLEAPQPPSAPAAPAEPDLLEAPAAPELAPLRPTLQATGGLVVYDASGEVLNPPEETEPWRYLDPFGSEAVRLSPELVNGAARINSLTLENDSPVSVTFIGECAGYRNTLGWYKIEPDGTIGEVKIIWANASGASESEVLAAWREAGATDEELSAIASAYGSNSEGGALIPGQSTVALEGLQAGDSFGFFLIPDGYRDSNLRAALTNDAHFEFRAPDGGPAVIEPGMTAAPKLHYAYADPAGSVRSGVVSQDIHHTAAYGDTLGLNGSGQQQVIAGVVGDDPGGLADWGVEPGQLLIGFEDISRPRGDDDFNDLVFRLDVEPAFIEKLEIQTAMPDVTIGHGDPTALIDAASVTFEGLEGAAFAFPGWDGESAEGEISADGQTLRYHVEEDPASGTARLRLEAPEGAPAAAFEAVLDNISFVSRDPNDQRLPEGEIAMTIQVESGAAVSDIVRTAVRVAHDPDRPPVAPSAEVIATGPTNDEIAAANAQLLADWQAQVAAVEAANAEMTAAYQEALGRYEAALEAYAALVEAQAAAADAVAEAQALVARVEASADAVDAAAQAARAATDEAEAAREQLASIAQAREEAAQLAEDAQGALADATAAAQEAASAINALAERVAATRAEAAAAVQVYDEARLKVESIEGRLDQAHDAAVQAHAVADAAREAVIRLTEQARASFASLETANAARDAAGQAAADAHQALSERLEAAEAARDAAQQAAQRVEDVRAEAEAAHEAWLEAPDDPALALAVRSAIAAHAEALEAAEAAAEVYRQSLDQVADARAEYERAAQGLAQADQAVAEAEAVHAQDEELLSQASAEFGQALDAAALADDAQAQIQSELDEAIAEADGALQTAQELAAQLDSGAGALEAARAIYTDALAPQVEAAQSAFDAAVDELARIDAEAGDMLASLEEKLEAAAEASDAYADAAAAHAMILDEAQSALSAADQAIDDLAPLQEAWEQALDGYEEALSAHDLGQVEDGADSLAQSLEATADSADGLEATLSAADNELFAFAADDASDAQVDSGPIDMGSDPVEGLEAWVSPDDPQDHGSSSGLI